jgi:hypothetical protein
MFPRDHPEIGSILLFFFSSSFFSAQSRAIEIQNPEKMVPRNADKIKNREK